VPRLYMTLVSNRFQLLLERDNAFDDYQPKK
jgi:hypothetical protein